MELVDIPNSDKIVVVVVGKGVRVVGVVVVFVVMVDSPSTRVCTTCTISVPILGKAEKVTVIVQCGSR